MESRSELFELMQRMRRIRYTFPAPEGVTPSEARTVVSIEELHRCHEETRPGRVAEFTRTTPSALSQTFKSLEEKGFIERRRTGDDYRGVTVSLTTEGRHLAEESRRLHDEHMDQVMAYLGEQDTNHLVRILRRVVEFYESRASGRCDAGGSSSTEDDSSSRGGGDAPCA